VIEYALQFGFAAASLALLLNLWRLLRGPALMDRVLAVDTMVINIIALIILFGIQQRSTDLLRGRAAVRDVRLHLHRRLLPLHPARRRHRVSGGRP
jgi:multicomponent K+:H+ antiporter subunit F